MIKICVLSDIAEVADFMYWANNRSEQYSGFCSTNRQIIQSDLEHGLKSQTDLIVASCEAGAIDGVMTAHIDSAVQSADCCGPFVKDYDLKQAEVLFEAMLTYLPRPMALQFFFSEQNNLCLELMKKKGAKNQGREMIMNLSLERCHENPYHYGLDEVKPLSKAQNDSFISLHDHIFPESYVSGKDVVFSIGKSRSVYVIENEGIIRGYGVLRYTTKAKTVAAEIIAVRQEDRGKSYGKKILSKMLSEAFERDTVTAVELVVEAGNTAAIGLYTKMGFDVKMVNCGYVYQMSDISNRSDM